MRLGWHLNNQDPPRAEDWRILERTKPGVVLAIDRSANRDILTRILEINPDCHVILRPYYVPSDSAEDYQRYLDTVASLIAPGNWEFIPPAQRHLQIFNEQNMPRWSPQWEGFGDTPEDMIRFDDWFTKGYDQLKAVNPTWQIGWTPLTIGNRDCIFPDVDQHGVHYYMHGPEASKTAPTPAEIGASIASCLCHDSLLRADEYYAHIYTGVGNLDKAWSGLRFQEYAKYFPKPLDVWLPECGVAHSVEHHLAWFNLCYARGIKGLCYWRLGVEVNNVDHPAVIAMQQWEAPEQPEPPDPPDPPTGEIEELIRHGAVNRIGMEMIAYNPDATFPHYARLEELGAPLTNEFDTTIGSLTVRAQGFAGAIVLAEVGKWDEVDSIEW
ncbi:MAG: hypothetical protein GWN93_06835 [Deltaproteobacteria bacterium]|nr:hypothetical protein [Deltaproteobacteria bacterium]